MRNGIDRIKHIWVTYERRISSVALIIGFTIDWLTLTRIDQLYDNLVLLSYITVATLSIFSIQFYYTPLRIRWAPDGTRRERWSAAVTHIAPVVLQFAFGGLFSGFFIFYSRSATIASSWPFILALLALLVGNEFLQRGYRRLVLQVAVLYFAILSYSIFTVPILIGTLGVGVFIISVAVSVGVIWIFLRALAWLNPIRFRRGRFARLATIIGIAAIVSASYAANVIPPIPLSLKEAWIAHGVERQGNVYNVATEQRSFQDVVFGRDTFHTTQETDQVYLFSAVFAPTGLQTGIVHRWQYYADSTDRWITRTVVPYPLIGGRDGGFRGYSVVTINREGDWRVDIETKNGRTIGRRRFRFERTSSPPNVREHQY